MAPGKTRKKSGNWETPPPKRRRRPPVIWPEIIRDFAILYEAVGSVFTKSGKAFRISGISRGFEFRRTKKHGKRRTHTKVTKGMTDRVFVFEFINPGAERQTPNAKRQTPNAYSRLRPVRMHFPFAGTRSGVLVKRPAEIVLPCIAEFLSDFLDRKGALS
jgi:hypothetical protein